MIIDKETAMANIDLLTGKTPDELKAVLRKAIQYFRLASRSGSGSREADALVTLIMTINRLTLIGSLTGAEIAEVVAAECGGTVDRESVHDVLSFICGE